MERRLTGLDGMRGMAALVVLVMHVSHGLEGGHLAVDFFFMLSGYVMARTYEVRLRQGAIAPSSFILARFQRFWPIMATAATIGLGTMLLKYGPSLPLAVAYLAAVLLIPSGPTIPYVLNLPAWSIFYELLANAAHATCLAKLRTRWLVLLIVVSGAGLGLTTMVAGFPRILGQTTPTIQGLVIFRLAFAYLAGIVIFRLCKDKQPVRLPYALGFVLLPLYVLLVWFWPFSGWQFPFIIVLAPIMILCGLDQRAKGRALAMFGKMSFPLYALHFPVMQLAALYGVHSPYALIMLSISVSALWLVPWRSAAAGLLSWRYAI
jgi:peptidoglycan/LPS O-acetylase OafA/YrhL